MSAHLTDEEMARRELVLDGGGASFSAVHAWLREAHAALRAEREEYDKARELVRMRAEQIEKLQHERHEVVTALGPGSGGHPAARAQRLHDQAEADRRLLERCREWLRAPEEVIEIDEDGAVHSVGRTLLRDLDARLGEPQETGRQHRKTCPRSAAFQLNVRAPLDNEAQPDCTCDEQDPDPDTRPNEAGRKP